MMRAVAAFLGQNLFPLITCGLIIYMAVEGANDRERLYQQQERKLQLLLTAAEDDQKLSEEQQTRLKELKDRAKDLVNALESPDNLCLGPADTQRLRGLWD